MNAITTKIKKIRSFKEITQEQMAEKLNLSTKAYQKIENGITKLDVDRLTSIAEILDISVADLINAEDSIYVHQVYNQVGVANKDVILPKDGVTESERKMFEKMIEDKDKIIEDKDKEITFLRELLKGQNK